MAEGPEGCEVWEKGVHLSVSTVVLLVYLCPMGAINHLLAEHFTVLEIRKLMPFLFGNFL